MAMSGHDGESGCPPGGTSASPHWLSQLFNWLAVVVLVSLGVLL
jgi:hypothetical protein